MISLNCCGRDSAATPIMAHALLLSLTPALGTGAGAEKDLWGSEIINQPGRCAYHADLPLTLLDCNGWKEIGM